MALQTPQKPRVDARFDSAARLSPWSIRKPLVMKHFRSPIMKPFHPPTTRPSFLSAMNNFLSSNMESSAFSATKPSPPFNMKLSPSRAMQPYPPSTMKPSQPFAFSKIQTRPSPFRAFQVPVSRYHTDHRGGIYFLSIESIYRDSIHHAESLTQMWATMEPHMVDPDAMFEYRAHLGAKSVPFKLDLNPSSQSTFDPVDDYESPALPLLSSAQGFYRPKPAPADHRGIQIFGLDHDTGEKMGGGTAPVECLDTYDTTMEEEEEEDLMLVAEAEDVAAEEQLPDAPEPDFSPVTQTEAPPVPAVAQEKPVRDEDMAETPANDMLDPVTQREEVMTGVQIQSELVAAQAPEVTQDVQMSDSRVDEFSSATSRAPTFESAVPRKTLELFGIYDLPKFSEPAQEWVTIPGAADLRGRKRKFDAETKELRRTRRRDGQYVVAAIFEGPTCTRPVKTLTKTAGEQAADVVCADAALTGAQERSPVTVPLQANSTPQESPATAPLAQSPVTALSTPQSPATALLSPPAVHSVRPIAQFSEMVDLVKENVCIAPHTSTSHFFAVGDNECIRLAQYIVKMKCGGDVQRAKAILESFRAPEGRMQLVSRAENNKPARYRNLWEQVVWAWRWEVLSTTMVPIRDDEFPNRSVWMRDGILKKLFFTLAKNTEMLVEHGIPPSMTDPQTGRAGWTWQVMMERAMKLEASAWHCGAGNSTVYNKKATAIAGRWEKPQTIVDEWKNSVASKPQRDREN
ncbi:hypothetical protein B0J11DRAFT_569440 [Dendryphion nanum]|uniref:Uncharacterized protein n=1 Tax=Dendryphion nanum TaxID=256645 RepID=A0A9P9DPG7_9PLEO|nr:hypothetical protein B0J11DRAFT_569440 [Dendryphion nanum]